MTVGQDAQWLTIAVPLLVLALIVWAGVVMYRRRRTPRHADGDPSSRTRRSGEGGAHGDGPR